MKKWWFSIVCYAVAVLLAIYSIVGAWFLDDESWWMTTQIISTLSSCLLLIIIGVANQPKKRRTKTDMSKKVKKAEIFENKFLNIAYEDGTLCQIDLEKLFDVEFIKENKDESDND